jgi:hypothetical protein
MPPQEETVLATLDISAWGVSWYERADADWVFVAHLRTDDPGLRSAGYSVEPSGMDSMPAPAANPEAQPSTKVRRRLQRNPFSRRTPERLGGRIARSGFVSECLAWAGVEGPLLTDEACKRLARIALAYTLVCETTRHGTHTIIGRALGYSRVHVRDCINDARARGMLTPTIGGRAGGTLTPVPLRYLDDADHLDVTNRINSALLRGD